MVNKLHDRLKAAAVKAAGFGDHRKAMLQDFATLTGGQVVSEELNIKIADVSISPLGIAKKVLITMEKTTIVDGAGEKSMGRPRPRSTSGRIASTARFMRQGLPSKKPLWPVAADAMGTLDGLSPTIGASASISSGKLSGLRRTRSSRMPVTKAP